MCVGVGGEDGVGGDERFSGGGVRHGWLGSVCRGGVSVASVVAKVIPGWREKSVLGGPGLCASQIHLSVGSQQPLPERRELGVGGERGEHLRLVGVSCSVV